MYKNFYLNIDGDQVLFEKIELNDDGTVKNVMHTDIYNALKQNPKVINVTHLGYIPYLGSEWNGTDFDCPKDKPLPKPDNVKTLEFFSFLVNNKHTAFCGFNPISNVNQMVIAALSSDPSITEETVYE